MHEAGLIADAISAELRRRGGPGPAALVTDPDRRVSCPPARPRSIEITILDPVRVCAEAAGLYAEVALRRHGFGGIPVEVCVVPVTCGGCGAMNAPAPSRPTCTTCGWPLGPCPSGDDPVRIATRWE